MGIGDPKMCPPPPAMVIPVRSEGTKYFFLSRSPMRALGAFSTITYGGDPNMGVRDPKREGDPNKGRRDPKMGPLRA